MSTWVRPSEELPTSGAPAGSTELGPIDFPVSDPEPLRAPDIGIRVVRGGAVRIVGYLLGILFTAGASVFLLRHLGVADFGRYMTVVSLVAIVAGITDAGLTAVGGRDLALRSGEATRRHLLANLLGLRLVVTLIGVVVALVFAAAADYGQTLVLGTLLAGTGVLLTSAQATMTLPLSVELRIGSLTASEVLKQASQLAGIALFVALGAGLLPFFGLFAVTGTLLLLVTPVLVGRGLVWRPSFDKKEWRSLIREALPLAASVAMGVLYFRLLIVVMSLIATALATGLFATSFRVVEILYGISALIATTALPVLAAAAHDRGRLAYMLQRMMEVVLLAACFLVVVTGILAEPVLDLLGGSQYRDAAPILQIQVFALIPVFLAHTCQLGLITIRRQSLLAPASGLALGLVVVLGFALIPPYGAKGAAVAAVAAECVFAGALLLLLRRADRTLVPDFTFVWKLALASILGAALGFVPDAPVVVSAAAAALVFGGVVSLTGAIPSEVWDSMPLRRPHRLQA